MKHVEVAILLGRFLSQLKRNVAIGVAIISSIWMTACTFWGPHERSAQAIVVPMPGHRVHGRVIFSERADGLQVTYDLAGLPSARAYGLHIHERGDCNAVDARSMGGIFSPGVRIGSPSRRPEGQLPNIRADVNGVATGFFIVPDLALSGIRSVLERAIVVSGQADDPYRMTIQKGSRLACGVIQSTKHKIIK